MVQRLFTKYKPSLAAALALSLAACGGGGGGSDDGSSLSPSSSSTTTTTSPTTSDGKTSIEGTIWERLPGPSGDRTEIAIGGIKNEAANRVYMCEKKGSTAAGFYKGVISQNNVITWDAEHGIPNAYVEVVNGRLVFDYRMSGELPTPYEKGSWSGECGPLENVPPVQLTVSVPSGLTGISVSIDGRTVPLIALPAGAASTDCSNPQLTYTRPRPSKKNSNGSYYTVRVTHTGESLDGVMNGGGYTTTTYDTTFYSTYFTPGACNKYQVAWGNMGYTLLPY